MRRRVCCRQTLVRRRCSSADRSRPARADTESRGHPFIDIWQAVEPPRLGISVVVAPRWFGRGHQLLVRPCLLVGEGKGSMGWTQLFQYSKLTFGQDSVGVYPVVRRLSKR